VNNNSNTFAMTKRCQSFTLKNRKCKKTFSFVCKATNLCCIHAAIYANKYAVLIQKIYRAYHSRKYLQNFKLMPRDIQCRILFYMREHHYIDNYNKSLQKILCKRAARLIGSPYAVNYRTNILTMDIMTHFRAHILKLNELYTLYTKYITITDTAYSTMLFNRGYIIKKYTEERLYASNYVIHHDTLSLENLIEINKIMSLMKLSIENYKNIYKKHYEVQ
jgi:hypothetical protein